MAFWMELLYLLINNNTLLFSCLTAEHNFLEPTFICCTMRTSKKVWPLKSALCCLPPRAFEDNLLTERWWGRDTYKHMSRTHSKSVSNKADQDQVRVILYLVAFVAYCKSFGNMPCLCEYHHLLTCNLIPYSLVWWTVAKFCNTINLTWCDSRKRHRHFHESQILYTSVKLVLQH